MSAPDANALPPAPLITTARTERSPAKSSTATVTASHIASEIALRRSGWLKVSQPMPSALRARILSVGSWISVPCCMRPVLSKSQITPLARSPAIASAS